MTSPNQILISSTRVEEGHHDRVTVWNRGANAGTLTVQRGDGAAIAELLQPTDSPFDAIAKACGCERWDYPGQLVRDVERVVAERDAARTGFANAGDVGRRLDVSLRQVLDERDAAHARIAELEAVLTEMLNCGGARGTWDAARHLACVARAEALLAKKPEVT